MALRTREMQRRRPVVTFTTDFGTSDGYAAAMKGVILNVEPDAVLVDVTHDVRPQRIAEAAFVLHTTVPTFPARTVHLVVVDPGVGSTRRPVAVETPRALFVAPDNGVLSWVVQAAETTEWPVAAMPMRLPADIRAVVLDRPELWRHPVSATFHGRDVFAPVAAHLARGSALAEVGSPTDELCLFPVPRPRWIGPARLEARVIHVDRFGNLTTSAREDDLRTIARPCVRIGDATIPSLVTHYAAGHGLVALVGSSGHLEVAVAGGNAAATLGVDVGAAVIVETGDDRDR